MRRTNDHGRGWERSERPGSAVLRCGRARLLVSLATGLAGAALLGDAQGGAAVPIGPGTADLRRDATVQAVERVLPSVVNISTESIIETRDPLEGLFREFFDPYYRRRPNAQKSLGSGVIIDEAGYILTNFHVVQRANRITVTLVDGREFEAKALSRTPSSDVALLKIVAPGDQKFQALRFAGDDDLLLGETVLALGNPFGLGVSVSRGILSSKTRRPPVENQPLAMEDWLQTDAAINPGNSGGPLVNLKGELIGLNVAVFREGQGIGFAVPVKRLAEAVSEIFTPEEVKGLWLGARFKEGAQGVTCATVEPGSPAEKAGLRVGDVVLRANDSAPRTVMELNREILTSGERRDVSLQVQRRNDRRELKVQLVPEREVFNATLIRQKLGVTVQELSAEAAAQLGLASGEGLVIAAVERNSPAARADLARGYVIRTLEGRASNDVRSVAKLLYAKKPGDTVQMELIVSRLRRGLLEIYPARVELSVR
jgi:serine protease Do